MGLFNKKKEETNSCCCVGNCTPKTMAKTEASKSGVGVKVLGSGCVKCKTLENATREALVELGILLYLLCIFSCCVHVVPSAPEFPISVFVFQFRKLLVSIRRLFPFRIPMNLDTLSLAVSRSACGCGPRIPPLR